MSDDPFRDDHDAAVARANALQVELDRAHAELERLRAEPATPWATVPAAPPVAREPWLARAGAWLLPSVFAACAAVVLAGTGEAVAGGFGPLEVAAAVGFAAMLALPALLVGAVVVRGLWAAWRPRQLAAVLIDARGASPRFAAWTVFLLLAAVVMVWATFNGVRWLALTSSFKPLVVSLAMPLIVVLAAAGLVAVSRPAVELFALGFARLERGAAARGRARLPPRRIVALVAVGGAVLVATLWFVTIRPRIGHFDLRIFTYPIVASALVAIAHALWPRLRARGVLTVIAAAAAVAAISSALGVRTAQPTLMLDLWSHPTVAGLAIDQLFDLDAVRSHMALTAFRPVARPGARHPDVILITIDTVRADHTPPYGGPAVMPVLAGLGNRGTVFDWAFSPGNVTRRSVPSIVLGVSPTRTHGRVAGWALRLDPRHVVLAERFKAAGYDTAGFFCCDSFWSPQHKLGINRGLDYLYIDKLGGPLAKAARAWLEARERGNPQRPLFLWMHILEPHNWAGDNEPPTDPERRKQYDAVLAQVDTFLADMVAAINARGPGREPIVAITADHGEGLGDHGAPYHSSDLYDSQIHVPLVVVGPGVRAQHVSEPVALIDLAPTLLDLAGFQPPGLPSMDGVSVAPLATGARAANPDGGYAFSAMVQDRSVATSARAIVVGRWKIIESPAGLELFDLRADPTEARNLAATAPAELARMKQLLADRARLDEASPFP